MAGMFRKTALYLGLVDDEHEEYDDYVDEEERVPPADRRGGYHDDREAVTRVHPRPASRLDRHPIPRPGSSRYEEPHSADADPRRAAPPVADPYRITTLQPRTYNEARAIGEHFRENVPVIINLTEMDDADAKRLVDFCAGLIFGLHGSIERVTNKVFLLSPVNVEVSEADKARIAEGGFFNQS